MMFGTMVVTRVGECPACGEERTSIGSTLRDSKTMTRGLKVTESSDKKKKEGTRRPRELRTAEASRPEGKSEEKQQLRRGKKNASVQEGKEEFSHLMKELARGDEKRNRF